MSQAGIINVITNNPTIPIYFEADTGFAVALFNVIKVLGDGGIVTSASGNTITIDGSAVTDNLTITGNQGGAQPPLLNNWDLLTDNSTPQFIGASSTFTLDFNLPNLCLGSSLPVLTVGTGNVSLGADCLKDITTGSGNVMVGNSCVQAFNIEQNNSEDGKKALSNLTESVKELQV